MKLNAKPLPAIPEVERSLIGSCLIVPENVPVVIGAGCQEDYFYLPANRYTWTAIECAFRETPNISLPLVADYLRKDGKLDACGGMDYLVELSSDTATTVHTEPLVRVLRDYAIRRRLILACQRLSNACFDVSETSDVTTLAHTTLLKAIDDTGKKAAQPFSQLVPLALPVINSYFDSVSARPWIQTGFVDIDRIVGGLCPGDLIVVAGRPSMGKSAFATCVALNAAVAGKKVLIFSPEMSAQQVVERTIAIHGKIDLAAMRTGMLPKVKAAAINLVAATLAAYQVWVDDSPSLTLQHVRTGIMRYNPDIVIVDYLQLMVGDKSAESKEQEISGLSLGLKTIAKQYNIPLIAVSQLNREVERRRPPCPMLSDLRGSGSVEQDADLVFLLYRPEYYGIEQDDYGSTLRRADVVIAKQRNGPTGRISLTWLAESTSFANREENLDGF